MKNRAKGGNKKGGPAYRTPSPFQGKTLFQNAKQTPRAQFKRSPGRRGR
ncbi:MAG: hypothetical protein Q8P39_02535 [Candidatus Yanofskybacteria bacterium]|nr:hypothetical protein [Candidatus Yanofskybacteria bacterium]